MKRSSLVLFPALCGAIALAACTPAPPTGTVLQDGSSSSTVTMQTDSSVSDMNSSADSQTSDGSAVSSIADTNQPRVIAMSVTSFAFAPNTVTLHQGEKVTIRLTDVAGIHSFMSNDLGINVAMQPGMTQDIVIPTDTKGAFSFRCGIPCGPGHRQMTGTIVID